MALVVGTISSKVPQSLTWMREWWSRIWKQSWQSCQDCVWSWAIIHLTIFGKVL
ncbi:hypothetical protein CDL15_Pgr017086 [Punica granatum]|uniref:Uncharacterized protein n=1 Tax=Punica granatum TaxID=22663 RepID=A0A218WYR4_PUNGR|nr:hypothetical protein CDL15_Pgr017086 [Punica granatum]